MTELGFSSACIKAGSVTSPALSNPNVHGWIFIVFWLLSFSILFLLQHGCTLVPNQRLRNAFALRGHVLCQWSAEAATLCKHDICKFCSPPFSSPGSQLYDHSGQFSTVNLSTFSQPEPGTRA